MRVNPTVNRKQQVNRFTHFAWFLYGFLLSYAVNESFSFICNKPSLQVLPNASSCGISTSDEFARSMSCNMLFD